jgi:demethylmenaquinone methyltransferase/2-methoxy-6-polyprenyl-1,4-benzoquinol methylase
VDQAKVLERYTKVASSYDRVVSLSAKVALFPLERYRREAVAVMNVGEGDTVLEIGCGTGLNFSYILERIGPEGRLLALDYTPAMLAEAAKKVDEGGWNNVQLIRGDAEEVEKLVQGPVDGVVSTACLCIVPGWERAIAGAAGLLRAGDRLVVLDFQRLGPRGPLGLFTPLVKWWTRHYGFAEPDGDFGSDRAWRQVMGRYLNNVVFREYYFGTLFLCYGEKGLGEGEGQMSKDPVCGMELQERKAAATSSYAGRTYYFCSKGCKEAFDKEPQKYTARG